MTPHASWFDLIRAPLGGISTPPLNWTSWNVVLQGLDCLRLPDTNGRKPYIWPVLVRFDDFTKTTPIRVAVTGPDMQDVSVSVPLSQGMHAGDPPVQIPATMGTAGNVGNVGTYTFDAGDITDGAANRIGPNLILVVALLEHHDFGEDVIKAGYTVFQSALQEAVAADLPALLLAIKNNDIAAGTIIGNCISNAVNNAVRPAMRSALDDLFTNTQDNFVEAQPAPPWNGVQSTSDFLPVLLQHLAANGAPDTQYEVSGQLQVGTTLPPSDLPPFDCASSGPSDDVTLDNLSQITRDLTSLHGSITINQKVDQHSAVRLTACGGVQIGKIDDNRGKIDNHSHATIVARGDVTIGEKIDQHSSADINSQGAIHIGQKIDQHSVAKLTAGTTVHIGKKIDQHSTAAIFAVGDINIEEGIDQHSTAYITSLNGSITIGKVDGSSGAVDGNSVVTLRAPNGNITIKQKVAGGATVNWSANNFTCPDTSGGNVNPLPPFPPIP